MTSTPQFSFDEMRPLLRPRTIAIIGASVDPSRIGGRPLAYMTSRGFQGEIFPVNPRHPSVQGRLAYPSIDKLPVAPDLAIVAVPAAAVADSLTLLGQRGAKAAVVFSSGFAESGAEGLRNQVALAQVAKSYGLRLLGPNCLGLFNAHIGCFATFSTSLESGWPLPGRVAIASQSGAYGSHLFAAARSAGIGVQIMVTTGNEADITLGEAIGGLVEDEAVDVIAAYSEGVRDGASFIAALEAARRAHKPVAIMKAGTSAAGAAAAISHTAALAGQDAITGAVLEEFGAVRARTTEQLLDIVRLAVKRIYPVNISLGVLTVSGGAGVLISDAAADCDLPMPPLPMSAQESLRELIPYAGVVNPVDCTAQVLNDFSLIGKFSETMLAAGRYSAVLNFFSQVGDAQSISPSLRRELREVSRRHPDCLHVLSILASAERVKEYEDDGFVVYADPSRAVVAIHAMGCFGEAFARPARSLISSEPPVHLPNTILNEAAAKRLLARAGVPAVPERVCRSATEAARAGTELGYPVVMKILSADIQHKTEIGGVILNIASPAEIEQAFDALYARASAARPDAVLDGVLIARQLTSGVECIVGIQRDPAFGPIAVFGLGGIFVEVLGDAAFRRCPFDEAGALQLIRSTRAAKILAGVRGRPPADIPALARLLSNLSRWAAAAGPRLKSIDLNPVLVMPIGEGAYAVDALIELETVSEPTGYRSN